MCRVSVSGSVSFSVFLSVSFSVVFLVIVLVMFLVIVLFMFLYPSLSPSLSFYVSRAPALPRSSWGCRRPPGGFRSGSRPEGEDPLFRGPLDISLYIDPYLAFFIYIYIYIYIHMYMFC